MIIGPGMGRRVFQRDLVNVLTIDRDNGLFHTGRSFALGFELVFGLFLNAALNGRFDVFGVGACR